MPQVDFEQMPEDARLWIFAADRSLDDTERDRLLERVDAFLDQWTAHGAPLTAARDWRYDRFLFVAVDESAAGVSGCSIDALVRDMRVLEAELHTTLVDHAPVVYRDGSVIRRVPREQFADLATGGSVGPDTVVFNNALTTVGEVRAGAWEVPADRSWHRDAFF